LHRRLLSEQTLEQHAKIRNSSEQERKNIFKPLARTARTLFRSAPGETLVSTRVSRAYEHDSILTEIGLSAGKHQSSSRQEVHIANINHQAYIKFTKQYRISLRYV
jgi:hypothetical protein